MTITTPRPGSPVQNTPLQSPANSGTTVPTRPRSSSNTEIARQHNPLGSPSRPASAGTSRPGQGVTATLANFMQSRSASSNASTSSVNLLAAQHQARMSRIRNVATAEEFAEIGKSLPELPPAQQTEAASALASQFAEHLEEMGFQDGFNTLKMMTEVAEKLTAKHPGSEADVNAFASSMLSASGRLIKESQGPNGAQLTDANRGAIVQRSCELQEALGKALVAHGAGRTPEQFQKLLHSSMGQGTAAAPTTQVSATFGMRVLPSLIGELPKTVAGNKQAEKMLAHLMNQMTQAPGLMALVHESATKAQGPLEAMLQIAAERRISLPKPALDALQEMVDTERAVHGTPAEVTQKFGAFAATDGAKMRESARDDIMMAVRQEAPKHIMESFGYPPTEAQIQKRIDDRLDSETTRSFLMMANVVNGRRPDAMPEAVRAMAKAYAPFVSDPKMLDAESVIKQLTGSVI